MFTKVNILKGVKESDTGLSHQALWDNQSDRHLLTTEQSLQVARCTKILKNNEDNRYIVNVKQFAKFVVDLADTVAPSDIEEGMRVGVERGKYQIHLPLAPKIDPTVTMMQVIFLHFLLFKFIRLKNVLMLLMLILVVVKNNWKNFAKLLRLH